LVVGIFPESDHKALEDALTAQQIDLAKVKAISATPPIEEEPCQLEFVDVIEEMDSNSLADDMTKGVGVWDETGTDVPGLGGTGRTSVGDFVHRDDPTRRYLAGFDVPDDEVDNFGDAVADGRTVVLYTDAGAQADAIAAAFKAAGLRNVRAY
jgi:rhodanese-related sulfurtransferase